MNLIKIIFLCLMNALPTLLIETFFHQLRGIFIEEKYKAMCADTGDVVLETIYYCQTDVAVPVSLCRQRKHC